MSIHVCKCEHNGCTEYQLRYPGMTQEEAQALADRINGGELVGAEHPLRKDAERYRWLRHGDNDERCIRLTSQGEPYMLRGELLDRCVDEGMAADAEQEAHTGEGPGIGAA